MTRRPKARPASGAPNQADLEDAEDGEALLVRVSAHLKQLLARCEAAVESGEAGPQTYRDSASVARAIARCAAEHRAFEKLRRSEQDRINAAAVLEWAFKLPAGERTNLIRELEQMNRQRSVL